MVDKDTDSWRRDDDDDEMFGVEECLDNSKGMVPVPDKLGGIPARSENGCPNASQSFSTRA